MVAKDRRLEDFKAQGIYQVDGYFFAPCHYCNLPVRVTNPLYLWPLCEVCANADYFCDARQYVSNHNSLARKYQCEASLTPLQWLRCVEFFEGRCAYCGGPFERLEHAVPLLQGGGTTVWNCFPACIKCDRAKVGKAGIPQNISSERRNKIYEYLALPDLENPPYRVVY